MSLVSAVLASAPVAEAVEVPAHPDHLLALTLLRDETAIDRMAGDVEGATALLPPLAGMIVAGFAAHAAALGLFLATGLPLADAAHHAAAWFAAATGGFFIAVGTGLPSYWFYGIVARVPAPAWRLAVELLRVQAVGAVVLGAVIPFWLAGTLALAVLGSDVTQYQPWVWFSHSLPFLSALPGVTGLYRVLRRMRVARGIEGRFAPLFLTAWWVVLFQYTAPITMFAIFRALA